MTSRARLSELVALILPLVASYGATIAALAIGVRVLDPGHLQLYVLVGTFLPQFGLWADLGRATNVLTLPAEAYDARRARLISTVPILSVPTLIVAGSALLLPSFLSLFTLFGALWRLLAVVLAGSLLVQANLLRQHLLRTGRLHRFFSAQLWVSAGLPFAFLAGGDAAAGAPVLAAAYYLHMRATCPPVDATQGARQSRWATLRGDRYTWTVGATQLLAGASVAAEIPLLLALGGRGFLPYVAITRLYQGVTAVSGRPLEAGLSSLLTHDHAAWRGRLGQGFALATAGAAALLVLGPFVCIAWLGDLSRPPLPTLLPIVVACLATLAYRALAVRAVARRRGGAMLAMAGGELVTKVLLALVLSLSLDAGAAVASALCVAAVVAAALGRCLGVPFASHADA